MIIFNKKDCLGKEFISRAQFYGENTKKFISVALAAIMLLCLQACKNNIVAADNNPEKSTPVINHLEPTSDYIQPSMVPVNTPTPSGPQIFWSTSFESGDLRDLTPFGDFINQGSGTYNIVNQPVHAGNYAAALTIDTLAYSETGSHASYLFFWDDLPGDAYYYSAWYYLPAGVRPQDWWNVWQWKSTYDGDSDNSERIFSIGIREEGGILFPDLNYRLPGMDNISYKQYAVSVPVDQWFQLEAYYIKSMSDTGQIIVWLNGQEIFNIQNVQTALADNTLYWSVNNYTDSIIPNKYTLFVDDIAISLDRLSRFK